MQGLKTILSRSFQTRNFSFGSTGKKQHGFAIRRGDVDQGKMSILGGAIIAAAPAVIYAFYKIFGLDSSSAVGVGTFN
jgi:hypothetical protein